jgi:hypothetical protein
MSQTRAHRSRKCRGRARNGALPKDLCAYAEVRPSPRIGRPPKFEPETWAVTVTWHLGVRLREFSRRWAFWLETEAGRGLKLAVNMRLDLRFPFRARP